jgi:putative sterol carrier protein
VTLRVDVPTFIRLFGGELNPIAAWIDGLLDLDGDVLFAPRLIELFGGVRPFDDLTWSVEPPPPPADRSQEALAAS